MIILILVILVLVFSGIAIFTPAGTGRNLGVIIVGLALIALIGLTMSNDLSHVGMHQQTSTTTVQLKSLTASGPATIAEHPLGNGTEKIVVYRSSNNAVKRTPVAHTTTTIDRGSRSQVTITTKKWRFNNALYRWLFNLTNEEGQVASRKYNFVIPTTWRVISASKLK
ncbi:DUF4811 domain-containing protein [uncultured Secundilactobacillus sp.]|uniref:DUF4811 domain-containing protein n=1 Tax=uncultured Secundilactobacillus sp. TaxID=2813935 RepID=UPI00258A3E4A|nr:DUF4811 domain-containing protein [uncultured Secundilactobacillus sp.]